MGVGEISGEKTLQEKAITEIIPLGFGEELIPKKIFFWRLPMIFSNRISICVVNISDPGLQISWSERREFGVPLPHIVYLATCYRKSCMALT